MRNYAEELAYWYLRLNGFFLIENFVIHRHGETEVEEYKYASDADLVAVRFPYVKEIIGEEPVTCHEELFQQFDPDKILGLIVEVKSSKKLSKIKIFSDDYRMEYALRRIGFLKDEEIKILVNDKNWTKKDFWNDKTRFQVGKLLIHNWEDSNKEIQKMTRTIKLTSIKKFILDRFSMFKLHKYGDRIFFPSVLMQFLIWEQQTPLSGN